MNRLISAVPWRLVGLVVIAALLFGAGWSVNGWRMGEQLAELRAEHAAEQRNQALAQVNAVDRARLEEQRRTTAQTEIANAAIQQASAARDDARAADAVRRELLARVAALVNASIRPGDPGAIAGGSPARDPVVLLADVLGRADARAGELAQYADASRVAGQACERSYDALNHRPQNAAAPGQ
ncbi:DUF2514 domain-containing protein [Cupriavidus plantarum]|uniref:DUF2514 domain-containing protein n=1 Tax=Cupriavidus plantarum TaxID=942865 RepID=UPI00217CC7BF|nr:DUF2514 domain-containing protein [Cupriavidus plantarum]